MKDILVLFDDIVTRNRPLLLTTLAEEIHNTNQNLNIGHWSLTKNDLAMSITTGTLNADSVNAINYKVVSGIVVVVTGQKLPHGLIDQLTTQSAVYKCPVLFMSNIPHPSITTYSPEQIKICNNFDDISLFLNTVMTKPSPSSVIKMSSSETPSLGTSPWQYHLSASDLTIDKLVHLFENTQLPLENWTHKTQLSIILYSIRKYGYENSIDEKSWLMLNWKKYIFNVMNLEYNTYWHYSLIHFWVNILNKYANYPNVPFDHIYMSDQLAWIRNPELWKYYYTKDVLFSPHARDCWVEPDLRKI